MKKKKNVGGLPKNVSILQTSRDNLASSYGAGEKKIKGKQRGKKISDIKGSNNSQTRPKTSINGECQHGYEKQQAHGATAPVTARYEHL